MSTTETAEPLGGFDIPDDIISTQDDPERASEMSQKALGVGEQPEIDDAPIGHIHMPGGWIGSDGTVHHNAVVSELTGVDEEKLARVNPAANYPLFLQTLLKAGLESIGGMEPDEDMLNGLLVGDREALLLGIRIATYGNNLDVSLTCPQCGEEDEVILELDEDIPIKEMETPAVRQYDVDLRNQRVAVVTPATTHMQDSIWDMKKTSAEIKTSALERCVMSIDGRPVNRHEIRNLGLADRKTLINFLADLQPGPDYEGVRLPCQSCGLESPLVLDLADLFR